jgi:hypothetical protein
MKQKILLSLFFVLIVPVSLGLPDINDIMSISENISKLVSSQNLVLKDNEQLAGLDTNTINKIANLDKDSLEKLVSLRKETLEQIVSLNSSQIEETLKGFRIVRKVEGESLIKIAISPEEETELQTEIMKLQKKYLEVQLAVSGQRILFANSQHTEIAKNMLVSTIDLTLISAQRSLLRAQLSTHISDSDAEKVMMLLEKHIASLSEYRKMAQEAQSKEDIQRQWEQASVEMSKTKNAIKISSAASLMTKVGELLSDAKYMDVRINNTLYLMGERGYGIDQLSDRHENYHESVLLAENKYFLAERNVESAYLVLEKPENASILIDEGIGLFNEAYLSLEEAHRDMKHIIIDIISITGDRNIIEKNNA